MNEINVQIGNNAEDCFRETMQHNGYNVMKANDFDNMNNHIDFYLERSGSTQSVDVKQANDSYDNMGIELVNKIGKHGFIFGNADLIAYLSHGCFLIFQRKDLLAFSLQYIRSHATQTHTSQNRQDIFFYIPIETLVSNLMHLMVKAL
jgi:hypothetical protein